MHLFARFAALAAVLALVAPAAPARSADAPIRVGLVCGGMTPMIAVIGFNDGSFEKAGVNVEKQCFAGGPAAVQALLGHSIDAFVGSYDHVLRQRARGFDVKAYAEIYDGYAYALVTKASSPLKSLADGKGQTFAVTQSGSLSDDALRLGLQKAGLNPERDVQVVAAGSGATMVAAIDTNRVAGGMLVEPLTTSLTADGKYKIIFDPTEPWAGNVVMASEGYVRGNEAAFRKMLAVMKTIETRTRKNPSGAIAPMQKDFPNVQPRIMLQAIQHQLAHTPKGLVTDRRTTDPVVKATLEKGDIKTPIAFGEAVDNRLVESGR